MSACNELLDTREVSRGLNRGELVLTSLLRPQHVAKAHEVSVLVKISDILVAPVYARELVRDAERCPHGSLSRFWRCGFPCRSSTETVALAHCRNTRGRDTHRDVPAVAERINSSYTRW